MEALPNEVLENIFCWVTDDNSLISCRLVSRRWNQVSVRFWKQLPSRRPQFQANELMNQFLFDMKNRCQDFPFSKVRFRSVNPGNISGVERLLKECSAYITDVDICSFDTPNGNSSELNDVLNANEKKKTYIKRFLECLDVSVLPHLEELRFEPNEFPLLPQLPTISLLILRILRIPNSTVTELLGSIVGVASLIDLAPNLQLLETAFTFLDQEHVTDTSIEWPFRQQHRRIPIIELKLGIIFYSNNTETLGDFVQKMEEWSNVRVIKLLVDVGLNTSAFVPRLTYIIQEIVDSHSQHLCKFTLKSWPSTFFHLLRLPAMPKLTKLKISFGYNREMLHPIEQNSLSKLNTVTLASFHDPANVFRSAVFDNVKTFCLYYPNATGSSESYTNWDMVFPNLENFTYINNFFDCEDTDFGYIEHLISRLQMESLKSVAFKVPSISSFREDDGSSKGKEGSKKRRSRKAEGFKKVFSGLDDFDKILEEASCARQEGQVAEQNYWKEIDKIRRPCLTTMTGLKTFFFDDPPIDDDFAYGILLRLKPLDRLFIHPKELSLSVFCKLIAHHNSFCSTEHGITGTRLPGEGI